MADLDAEGWLALLQGRLAQQQPLIQKYDRYFAGQHPLAFDSEPYRESFGKQLASFSDNWCELVIEAPVERLQVLGFRFTATSSPDLETPDPLVAPQEVDPTTDPSDDAGGNPADADAWAIWQANRLDAESVKGHTEAGKLGTAFLLVSPPTETGDGTPRITVEHPSQMIALRDPHDRRRILAGLKRYTAPNADEVAVVYTPTIITTFVSPRGAQSLLAAGLIIPGSYIGAWTKHTEETESSRGRPDRPAREPARSPDRRDQRPSPGHRVERRGEQVLRGHDRRLRVRCVPAAGRDRG